MKIFKLKNMLSVILCAVLIAAMALVATGCNSNKDTSGGSIPESSAAQDITVLGEGATDFSFTVTDAEGNETAYQISTDKQTVGDALLELDLIAGEKSEYGLYVKTVNGITVDYDTDGMYWAFYVDGEYAMSGVDTTDITAGAEYSFKVEK